MTLHNAKAEVSETARSDESTTGRGDPEQQFRIYRLCECADCNGLGKVYAIEWKRCPDCRGEGRTLDLVATAATPQDVGVALVTLADEGEFSECPVGILRDGGSWLIKPWLPSPRNVSDAGRVLAKAPRKGEK
jgi:hypothetical protein